MIRLGVGIRPLNAMAPTMVLTEILTYRQPGYAWCKVRVLKKEKEKI